MAVFRNDQVLFTFGVEAAQGGDAEMIDAEGAFSGASTALTNSASAGTRVLKLDSASSIAVGDFVMIGTAADPPVQETEVRRVEALSGTDITLDRPTAFYHAAAQTVKEITMSDHVKTTQCNYVDR